MSSIDLAPSDPPATPTGGATSSADLIARARQIAPTLIEQQADVETRTYYSEATHDRFREAGFYRMLVPRMFGGYETDIETFLTVAREIAAGCPSTGWMLCLGTSHALTAATVYEEQAQAEIFAATDFICPTTVRPQGKARRAADGGWIVEGEFNFCSGAPYGTHYMGHCFVDGEDGPMLFTAPRSQWQRLDDWGAQIGLKGSGSHSIRFEGGHIPDHWALPGVSLIAYDASQGSPGERLHGNPMFAGSHYSFFLMEAAAITTGVAAGAVDAFGELMRNRMTIVPPPRPRTEDPDYQEWYGLATGKVAMADAAWHNAAQQWMELAQTRSFTPERDMTLARICAEVIELSWSAVADCCVPAAGSSAMRTGERIERVYRDISTIHSHNALVAFSKLSARALSMVHFAE